MLTPTFGEWVTLHRRVPTGAKDRYGNIVHTDQDCDERCIGFEPPGDSGDAALYMPFWSREVQEVTVRGDRYRCGRFPEYVNPFTGIPMGVAVQLTLINRRQDSEQGER